MGVHDGKVLTYEQHVALLLLAVQAHDGQHTTKVNSHGIKSVCNTNVNDTNQGSRHDDEFNIDYDVNNLSIACEANVTEQGPRARMTGATTWLPSARRRSIQKLRVARETARSYFATFEPLKCRKIGFWDISRPRSLPQVREIPPI